MEKLTQFQKWLRLAMTT